MSFSNTFNSCSHELSHHTSLCHTQHVMSSATLSCYYALTRTYCTDSLCHDFFSLVMHNHAMFHSVMYNPAMNCFLHHPEMISSIFSHTPSGNVSFCHAPSRKAPFCHALPSKAPFCHALPCKAPFCHTQSYNASLVMHNHAKECFIRSCTILQ